MKHDDIPPEVKRQLDYDQLVYGEAFCVVQDGKYKRVCPSDVLRNMKTGEFEVKL